SCCNANSASASLPPWRQDTPTRPRCSSKLIPRGLPLTRTSVAPAGPPPCHSRVTGSATAPALLYRGHPSPRTAKRSRLGAESLGRLGLELVELGANAVGEQQLPAHPGLVVGARAFVARAVPAEIALAQRVE